MDRAELGQVSSQYFSFPCHSFIPLTAPLSSPSIIQGWYNRSINVRSNSALGYTQAKMKKSKISGFHGGDYEEWRILGYYAVWLL
jgi:hypothetical protein